MTATEMGADTTPTLRRPRRSAPHSSAVPDRTTTLTWQDARRPLAAYGASLLLILTTAWVAMLTSGGTDRGRGPWPRLPESTTGIFRILGRWDAAWYVDLARNGYPDAAAYAKDVRLGAFYPVIPGLIRTVSALTGIPEVAAGMAVGIVCGAAAVLVVWQLTRELAGRLAADRAATLLAFFPAAFVFLMPYTEGLAIAAAGGAILATRRDRWVLAGLLGAVATATRSNTVVIVLALAVAAWGQGRKAWWAPAIAASGVAVTWTAMWARTGEVLSWMHAERIGWKEQMDFGAGTVRHIQRFIEQTTISLRPTGLIDLTVTLGVVLAVIGVIALWRWRPPLPVLVYGLGALALAGASSVVGPRPRMILGAFPLIMAVGVLVPARAYRWVVGASALLLVAASWITFTTIAVAP